MFDEEEKSTVELKNLIVALADEDRKNLKKFWLQQTPEDPFQEGRIERITLL